MVRERVIVGAAPVVAIVLPLLVLLLLLFK
jgi:hypothetical protein